MGCRKVYQIDKQFPNGSADILQTSLAFVLFSCRHKSMFAQLINSTDDILHKSTNDTNGHTHTLSLVQYFIS
jgi:hypothetical protein